jgi:lipopolysaccharide export system protein LptA
MKRTVTIIICGIIFLTPSFATSKTSSPTPAPSNQPNIKILSDQMDCNQEHSLCVAKGNATAEKLGDSKVKILKADQIKAYFAKEGQNGPLKVVKLEAEGNVFFIIGDIIIQGKRGHYVTDSEVAEVFDNVKITNGSNQLDGGYGKVNMKTGHYSIKRDGEPVQALIFTKEQAKEGLENGKR